MSLFVNTNVSSLNAQRQLFTTGNNLSTAFERLSSGFRINSAADDAAYWPPRTYVFHLHAHIPPR